MNGGGNALPKGLRSAKDSRTNHWLCTVVISVFQRVNACIVGWRQAIEKLSGHGRHGRVSAYFPVVAVVVFLIYRMIQVSKQPLATWKKAIVIIGGLLLLFAPFGMFLRFFAPTIQYLIIYPAAIGMYLYMIREL